MIRKTHSLSPTCRAEPCGLKTVLIAPPRGLAAAPDTVDQMAEQPGDPEVWRNKLTFRTSADSRATQSTYPGARRPSESDLVCWQTAAPDVYYKKARVDLAQIEAADAEGNTWVHRATESKNVDVVEDLLDRVDNRLIDCANERGTTPLHCAIRRDAIDVACALIARGADVAHRDRAGNTALGVACLYGAAPDVVAMLLDDAGADINVVNSQGDTPLMLAVIEHHNHLIDVLIRAPRLDWHAHNTRGQTIDRIAIGAHNIMALALIMGFYTDRKVQSRRISCDSTRRSAHSEAASSDAPSPTSYTHRRPDAVCD